MSSTRKRLGVVASTLLMGAAIVVLWSPSVQGAASEGCTGGGFSVTLGDGTTLSGEQRTVVSAGRLGSTLKVRGRYVEFDITSSTFAVLNYAFTGAANPLDITGGRRTVVFAAKVPDHRGLTLSGDADVDMGGGDLVIERSGPGLDMKIQAKDCAQGGLFQMEPERDDGTRTRITHTLATGVFYFDNPNFRAREGDVVPFKDTTVTVTPRINFATDVSAKFVGRDSPQVANRILQGCVNTVPAPRRPGGTATVDHCGGVSVWDVASGGRMGAVFGEDATEVAPPATDCTQNCQARNRVRGQAVVLGFPFPVPEASRLKPRFP